MKLVSVLALLTLLAGYSGGADDSNAYRMSGKRGKNDAADEVQTLRAPILVVSGVKLFTTLIRHVVNLPRC